jgi:hypothetical protein
MARGAIAVRTEPGAALGAASVPGAIARRLRRVNWVAASAFTVGGSLFALGAAEAQLGSGDATTAASIYFAGGLFFNTGGYASLLGAINAPRSVDPRGTPVAERWRWWSYEPQRIAWLSTFVLLAGTLAFCVSLIHSLMSGLTTQQVNRLIWTPEMIGCVMFLISALAAFTRPATSSEINVAVANWGTLTGAVCFAVGGVMQAFERPRNP